MNIVPKSEEAIAGSLTVLRWQNRFAAVMLGAFSALFASMMFAVVVGVTLSQLPVIGILGAVAGLIVEQKCWMCSITRLRQSFIRLDGDHLEVQGFAAGGTTHVRFRIADILSIEIGRKRDSIAGALPVVRALDGLALAIREKSGASIAFEWAGVVFRREDLAQLVSTFTPHLQK